jgi:hypothetical protein
MEQSSGLQAVGSAMSGRKKPFGSKTGIRGSVFHERAKLEEHFFLYQFALNSSLIHFWISKVLSPDQARHIHTARMPIANVITLKPKTTKGQSRITLTAITTYQRRVQLFF